jgi:hypothetical protein
LKRSYLIVEHVGGARLPRTFAQTANAYVFIALLLILCRDAILGQ